VYRLYVVGVPPIVMLIVLCVLKCDVKSTKNAFASIMLTNVFVAGKATVKLLYVVPVQ